MEIKVNDKNEITAYAVVGGVLGEEIPDEIVPEDFRERYDTKFYLYENGEIKENPNYIPPTYEEM
ncbi:DUF2977 domain-containing protein [Staphylococcus pseudoxylosus]|uniref:DUF2977 domain-containing protein n=1 Tax=Staphylococcus pseudoxylosus TaxID=2282419 RepID=UPI003905F65D